MNLDKYKDIGPYRGADIQSALDRVMKDGSGIGHVLDLLIPGDSPEQVEKKAKYREHIHGLLQSVKTYDDFQRKITAGIFLDAIMKSSVNVFSTSGSENIEKDKAYLFMSNHRDIVLDCALIDYALIHCDRMICEMAIGDNLLTNQFVTDLFKLNGGVTVKRTLPMREKYLESVRLSSYFVEIITEENKSIWVAQKSGRAKDGLDNTTPAIIKMLHLSQKSKGISFNEVVNRCHIVPVAVSYEYDPCDLIKSKEEVDRIKKGERTKKKYEDIISIVHGLKGYKGNIHIAFGTPIQGAYENSDEVAQEIDRQIHLNYKLWPTNCFAYDYLEGKHDFASSYASFDSEKFLARFKDANEDVKQYALNAYANPVRSFLAAQKQ
ncbi:1-acyl-sn-glycerol-3-phosphate acyltransferase [Sphaerochaeta pleomorpha str. Grapes]|uniref:1-acyl-sn-glycerol-3-phosphate acyltransferase n=1 Tax=Sphaerochaeta pleomorpha (strain ATCC BAA-1885 / DSM 22778 / Grapes) TaxID=158190 RepID=G8QTN0_SPHPG|nr:1-acyl-sn-glycerol-3-phosphate acyltransferase [Sphaerochaeta pleomorpha]AEV27995.1 1-acyl-sn-glycerol-3-phosphate acyltransferase [Sphaerochaeta pleomorpha str. Grapes]